MNWYALIILIIVIILISIMCFFINQNLTTTREPFVQTITIKPIPYTFYWINLDTATDRYKNMTNIFKNHNINHHRISAIRGGPDQYNKEIACTKSHMKAIQTFYNSNEDVGIICEDDLTMEYQQYWRQNLTDVVKNSPTDWEILQLALIPCYCTNSKICSCFPFANVKCSNNLYIPFHPWFSSALCYVINRKGAAKITLSKNAPTNIAERYIFGQVNTYTYKYPKFT